MKGHLTDDELLDRLYGLAEAGADTSKHLEDCDACFGRLRSFERRRAALAVPPPVSAEFLAAQRRAIYARVDERPGTTMRWAPAVAAVFLLAMGVFLYNPAWRSRGHAVAVHATVHNGAAAAPSQVSTGAAVSDEQLFSDVYSMEQSAEPRAAAPIHALFEAATYAGPAGQSKQ
jgi:hypothetical protein